jgi:hypothetical protein
MAGVPSRNKMYKTLAACKIHSDLHFAWKSGMYTVHCDEKKIHFASRHYIYLGHTRSSGSDTLFSYSMLAKIFFLYIAMEKKISTFLRYLIILHLI